MAGNNTYWATTPACWLQIPFFRNVTRANILKDAFDASALAGQSAVASIQGTTHPVEPGPPLRVGGATVLKTLEACGGFVHLTDAVLEPAA